MFLICMNSFMTFLMMELNGFLSVCILYSEFLVTFEEAERPLLTCLYSLIALNCLMRIFLSQVEHHFHGSLNSTLESLVNYTLNSLSPICTRSCVFKIPFVDTLFSRRLDG